MLKRNPGVINNILRQWIIFNALLLLSALIFNTKIATISWINCSIYFAIGLLSFNIQRVENFNRDIFLNTGFLFFGTACLQLLTFTSQGWLFLPEIIVKKVALLPDLFLILFAPFAITYFIIKYLYNSCSRKTLFITVLSTTAVIYLANYFFYLSHGTYSLPGLDIKINKMLFFTFFFLIILMLFYLLKILLSDRPTGEYLHVLMAAFFFWCSRGVYNSLLFPSGEKNSNMIEYHLSIILIFFFIILAKKLNYCLSDFGKFYENLIYGSGKILNISIKRRDTEKAGFYFELAKSIFCKSKVIPFFVVILLGLHLILNTPLYLTLTFSLNFLFIILLFLFSLFIYQRRERRGNFIQR